MRANLLRETVQKSRSGPSVERDAVRAIGPLWVVETRCLNLRCPSRGSAGVPGHCFGFRRPEEWVDWRSQACPKCGKKRHALVAPERPVMVEVNAPAKVVRFRDVDPETLEFVEGSPWVYQPFEMGAHVEQLAEKAEFLPDR